MYNQSSFDIAYSFGFAKEVAQRPMGADMIFTFLFYNIVYHNLTSFNGWIWRSYKCLAWKSQIYFQPQVLLNPVFFIIYVLYVQPKFLPGPNLNFFFMKNSLHTSIGLCLVYKLEAMAAGQKIFMGLALVHFQKYWLLRYDFIFT